MVSFFIFFMIQSEEVAKMHMAFLKEGSERKERTGR